MAKFMKLTDAAKETGMSIYYLRAGCKNNTVPHICAGTKYLVNIEALLEKLDKESRECVK